MLAGSVSAEFPALALARSTLVKTASPSAAILKARGLPVIRCPSWCAIGGSFSRRPAKYALDPAHKAAGFLRRLWVRGGRRLRREGPRWGRVAIWPWAAIAPILARGAILALKPSLTAIPAP
ncbi:MAG TPA: hypothetical protein PLV87_13420, partial [Opitutaceae bacterium]|nr:hypothetical protein [Opitutaceae bacterium]